MLYFCCTSAAHAQATTLVGFSEDALVEVTRDQPYLDSGNPDQAYAVALHDPPLGFALEDYATRVNRNGVTEYLVPGRALNGFRRAVWPTSEHP